MSSQDQDISFEYNLNKVKNIFIMKIIDKIYDYKGIIYGGYVRDFIIADYYKSLYDKKFKNSKNYEKNYWNKQFDLETLHRTFDPKDINICMYNICETDKMLKEINELINNDFGMINVELNYKKINNNINNFNINNLYTDNNLGVLYIYKYTMNVGYIPYISKGHALDIKLNIVICKNNNSKPPFNKLDFLCNAFTMTREGISISRNTGIEKLDNLSIVEIKELEYKIIKDIVNFRTDYCINFHNMRAGNNLNPVNITKYSCLRIEKMINKSCKWQINNLPFIIEYPKKHSNTRTNCSICLENIRKTDCVLSIEVLNSKNDLIKCSFMHKDCFFKYMYKQIEDKMTYIHEDVYYPENCEEFYLHCPMRNLLDFDIKNNSENIEKYLIRDRDRDN